MHGQLQALALAARQGVQRLPEGEVAQAHLLERGADLGRCGHLAVCLLEVCVRLLGGQFQHVGDVFAAQGVLEDVVGEAAAFAHLAGHVHATHDAQLHVNHAGTVAVRAGAI